MAFDKNGNWHEEIRQEDDWGKSSFGTPGDNFWFGLKMLGWLLLFAAVGIGGWYLDRYVHYEWYYKDKIQQEVDERLEEERTKQE